MLLFAHLGIALGMAGFAKRADLVFLAIDSMLPDIKDKPLVWAIFGAPNNGRIFAHSLLFLLLLVSICVLSPEHQALASLTRVTLIHLAMDSM